MGADFQQLYAQLGIRAECSLDEFKHACRRRIGDLHPDRREEAPGEDSEQLHLDELLALYASAIQFHQRHGRLPGAMPATHATTLHRPRTPALGPEPPEPAQHQHAPQHLPHAVAGGGTATSSRYPSLILFGGALLLTAVAYLGSTAAPQDAADAADDAFAAEPPLQQRAAYADQEAADAGPSRLELGMDPTSVITLQGRPMRIEGDRWEYGPSWLRFDEEGLVDWYSSPLHPLETPHRSP